MKSYDIFEKLSKISVFEKNQAVDLLETLSSNNKLVNYSNNEIRFSLDKSKEKQAFCDATQTIN